MKSIIIIATSIITAISMTTCKSTKEVQIDTPAVAQQPQQQAQTRTLIVTCDSEADTETLLKAAKEYGAEVIYTYESVNGFALRIPEGKDIKAAIEYFRVIKGVNSVTRDRTYKLL